jgi:hypothetical protein
MAPAHMAAGFGGRIDRTASQKFPWKCLGGAGHENAFRMAGHVTVRKKAIFLLHQHRTIRPDENGPKRMVTVLQSARRDHEGLPQKHFMVEIRKHRHVRTSKFAASLYHGQNFNGKSMTK